jgi:hypothetical protein
MSGEGGVGSRLESAAAPGVAGLALGPLVPAAGKVFGTAKTLADPFFQAGRERMVGGVLNRFASNPSAAMQRLLAGGAEIVPGSRPMTSQIARDPGLAALQTPIENAVDETAAIAARRSEQNAARVLDLQQMARDPEAIAYAKAKRAAITGPMREGAFDLGSGVADARGIVGQIDAMLANPSNKGQTVQNALNDFKTQLMKEVDPATGAVDPRALYAIRGDIARAEGGKFKVGDRSDYMHAAKELGQLRNLFDDTIETAAPGYRDYMNQFRKMSIPIDQMKGLQAVGRQAELAAPDVATNLPVLSQAKFKQALATRADDLARLSPSQRTRLDAIMEDLNRATAPVAPGVRPPGSNTVKNLSVASIIGNMFGEGMANNTLMKTIARPIDFLYKLPEQDVQKLMVDAMLDPELAGKLMQKAGAGVSPATARALARKAYDTGLISAGTYIGAASGVSLDDGK